MSLITERKLTEFSIDVDYILLGKGELDGTNHGGSGGEPTYITFHEGEFITKISGKTDGRLVNQLTFTIRRVDGSIQTYGPYRKTGNTPFEMLSDFLAAQELFWMPLESSMTNNDLQIHQSPRISYLVTIF